MKKYILLTGAILLVACGRTVKPVAGYYTPREFDLRIGAYYDFSTVDWALLDTLYYRPYSCDWPDEYTSATGENHQTETDAHVWHLLRNARTKFHQDNLPLRSVATPEMRSRLDRAEAAFDTVFVRFMHGDYYLRAFPDAYENVMRPAIDALTY